MKVWVVMGNDYPDSVYGTAEAADRYCDAKKNDPKNTQPYGTPRIYWRAYEFELQGSK